MVVKSKIDLTYNTGVNSTETGILTGVIASASWYDDFTKVGVNYVYFSADGKEVSRSAFIIEGENINLLFEAIKDKIPTDLTEVETERYKFYLGFVIEMANTFGVDQSDIEIVTEA